MLTNSTSEVDRLEDLARQRFGKLSQSEVRLLTAAPRGEIAYCGPHSEAENSENDPSNRERWGSRLSLLLHSDQTFATAALKWWVSHEFRIALTICSKALSASFQSAPIYRSTDSTNKMAHVDFVNC